MYAYDPENPLRLGYGTFYNAIIDSTEYRKTIPEISPAKEERKREWKREWNSLQKKRSSRE